jgi:hypothetical protein
MDRRRFLLSAAAAPLALASLPALAARGGGTPLALVTCDTQSRVAVVDVVTGRIVRSLATIRDPRSVESDGATIAVVAHTSAGALTFIDGGLVEPLVAVRGLGAPRYTAIEHSAVVRAGRRVFVTDSERAEVVTLDLGGEILGSTAVGGPARHVSLHPFRNVLWTVLGSKASEIAVLDTSARPRVGRRLTAPFLAHDVAFDPSGRRAWVSSGDQRKIAVYTADGRLVRTVSSGSPPQHVSFGSGRAYVTAGDDGAIAVHDPISGRLLARHRLPLGSYNVQTGHRWVLSPSLSTGTLAIAGRSGLPTRVVEVSPSSHDACLVVGI